MSDWKETTIGNLCSIKHGYAYKGEFITNEECPNVLVTPGNFTLSGGFKIMDKPKYYKGPVIDEYILKEGDLIVTMTDLSKGIDTLGYSALVPKVDGVTFHHNQRIGLIENISKDVDKDFLYWIMRTRPYQKYVANSSSGTTVHHTSPVKISKYSFLLPTLSEQHQIASILSSFDSKIECNRKICNNLEAQAQALFKHWFIDFAPFKDCKFVESELGMIPEGWRVCNLGEVCKCELGGTPSRANKTYWGGDIAWINSGEINKFRVCEASEYITEEGLSRSATKLLPKKTTVLAITGATLGQISLLEIDTCANQSVVGVKENDKVPYTFIYPTIKSKIKELVNMQTGGAQQHINKDNIQSLKIVIAPDNIMSEYKDLTLSLYEEIGTLCFENIHLASIRDTLLPKLMSGQIKL